MKIFLGAAQGVGKTYEMLSAARARHQEGTDVVVGVVETHGRRDTEALLEGLEIIPRRPVDSQYARRTGQHRANRISHFGTDITRAVVRGGEARPRNPLIRFWCIEA